MNTTDFINKARLKHTSCEYDYNNTVYVKSCIKVIIGCAIHGDFTQTPNAHLRGQGCPKCGQNKKKITWLEKYGVEHPSKSPDIRAKTKEKIKLKYGVDHYCQLPAVKAKHKATMLTKYGVESSSQSSILRDKAKATMMERHGVEYAQQSPDIKAKSESTNVLRYGVKNRSQLHIKDILHLLEDKAWMYDQYIDQQKTAQAIADELGVDDSTINCYIRRHGIDIKHPVGYSYKSIQWLNGIMDRSGINIQHALSGGEYAIPGTKYRVDGFCEETNTIYEFHGDVYHGNPRVFSPDVLCHPYNNKTARELYEATVEREQQIKQLGYNLVVMWESDFLPQ